MEGTLAKQPKFDVVVILTLGIRYKIDMMSSKSQQYFHYQMNSTLGVELKFQHWDNMGEMLHF